MATKKPSSFRDEKGFRGTTLIDGGFFLYAEKSFVDLKGLEPLTSTMPL